MLVSCAVVWWCVDSHSILRSSIMLSVIPRSIGQSCSGGGRRVATVGMFAYVGVCRRMWVAVLEIRLWWAMCLFGMGKILESMASLVILCQFLYMVIVNDLPMSEKRVTIGNCFLLYMVYVEITSYCWCRWELFSNKLQKICVSQQNRC